ncbi:hypothetical protein KXW88_003957 [Aspergillus fumigatus]|nr:hypothetical protein KXW88_003957 [Aspergillus fumigatus]KAJ8225838.1 hypothetical protein LV156_009055 [Aspergillus fumigatus]
MPPTSGDRPANPDILIVEAWGQGFMVGSLILMIAITVANMKSGVFLDKMIVAEFTQDRVFKLQLDAVDHHFQRDVNAEQPCVLEADDGGVHEDEDDVDNYQLE